MAISEAEMTFAILPASAGYGMTGFSEIITYGPEVQAQAKALLLRLDGSVARDRKAYRKGKRR